MLKKLLFAGALSLLACAGAFATEIASVSFNFYSAGVIVPEGEVPAGVTICPKIRFHNPKLFGFAHPLEVNLDKTKSIKMKFKVKGGEGKVVVSVNSRAVKGGKKLPAPKLTCTEFILNDEEVTTPFTYNKWKAVKEITVEDGDTITLEASFEPAK